MIFRTITDDITGANKSIGLFGKSSNDFNKIINSFKQNGVASTLLNTPLINIDIDAIDNYNNAIRAGKTFEDALATARRTTNVETIALIESSHGAEVQTERVTAVQKASTIAAKAHSAALTAVNTALNVGIMLAVTVAVKIFAQVMNNAADSLEDVENRLQSNQTALSGYKSKIEELTKKLEELNQTDVKYLSNDERKELETETDYINSQLELYNLLAEAKQKAINDDYIKATMGNNQEIAYKKIWEEFNNGDWDDLFSSFNEASELKWYDFLGLGVLPHAFKKVDDGNYIAEADKLLNKYQQLQNKYNALQKTASEKGNNEVLEQNIGETQSQMYQTAAELSEYIEQIQTARDALYASKYRDEYVDIIADMDEAIANYQEALTGNVYADNPLGISNLQRDLD